MSLSDLFLSQLADPFRIGLLIALIFTMQRTRAATGVWLPLAAGALFVAVVIPLTVQSGGLVLPLWQVVAVGVVANVVLIAVALAVWEAYRRLRG